MKVISHVHLWSLTIGRQARSCTNCTPVAKCYRIASNVKICWSPVLVVIWILANWFPFRELKLKYVEVRRMNCWPYKFTSNSLTNHTLQKKTTHRPRGILLPTKNPYTESKKNNRHLYIYTHIVADSLQCGPEGSGSQVEKPSIRRPSWKVEVGPGGAPAVYTAAQYGHVDIVHVTWETEIFSIKTSSSGFLLGNSCGCWDFGVFFNIFFQKGIGKFCGSSVHGKN